MAVGLGDLVAWWYMMVAYGLLVGKVGCVSMIVGYKKFLCPASDVSTTTT